MLPFILIITNTRISISMKDKNWECKRCGDCCRYVAWDDEWTYGTLTEAQRKTIESQLELTNKGCKALAVREGELVCLSQHLFGLEAKPEGCRDWAQRCGMTEKVKELINNRALASKQTLTQLPK